MHRRHYSPVHRLATSLALVAALLTALALAANPGWHDWLHPATCSLESGHDEHPEPSPEPHDCAATLLARGALDSAPTASPSLLPALTVGVLLVGWNPEPPHSPPRSLYPPGRAPPPHRAA